VQCIACRRPRGRRHRFDIEIGPCAAPRNFATFVGGADVQRQCIVGRVDRDAGKAALAGGTGDANGNLAAIGDQ
jgi:hypothetical protein